MTRYPYITGWCGTNQHRVCRLRCTGPCACTCGHPVPTAGLRIGSLCSGYGGLDMAAAQLLGGTVAWHAETDPAAARLLAHHWPAIPNHGDITTADWTAVEPVDVLTAGWPCQPWSSAGKKMRTEDGRAIWPAVADAVRHLRPRFVFLENVPTVAVWGELERVAADLAALGYVGSWTCVAAAAVGAPHKRERLFILAHPADADGPRRAALPLSATAAWWQERDDAGRGGVSPAPDPDRGSVRQQPKPVTGRGGATGPGLDRRATTDPAGDGLVRNPRGAGSGAACGGGEWVAGGGDRGLPDARWGQWAPAIHRWERLTRPAPDPVELGRRGNRRLNPAFSEWMMGLPTGWVTSVPGLSRNDQLRLIGNGVVPQQGVAALRWLLAALTAERAA